MRWVFVESDAEKKYRMRMEHQKMDAWWKSFLQIEWLWLL